MMHSKTAQRGFVGVIAAAAMMLLPACAAQSVVSPGGQTSSPYAPVNEKARNGVVKYLNEGASFVRKSRRDNAYKTMYNACGGKYEIVNEGMQSDGGTIVPIGSAAVIAGMQYVYIEYRCVD